MEPEGRVMVNPEFTVGWTEMWVTWPPYLWLVSEVRAVLQDQNFKPEVKSRWLVSEVNQVASSTSDGCQERKKTLIQCQKMWELIEDLGLQKHVVWGEKGWGAGQSMRNCWPLGGHVVNHSIEQKLCSDKLLKVKVINGIYWWISLLGSCFNGCIKKPLRKKVARAIPWLI